MSEAISRLISSLVDNNLITDNNVFIVLMIVALFVIHKIFNPLKSKLKHIADRDDVQKILDRADNIDKSIDKTSETISDNFKDLHDMLGKICDHLSRLEMKSELNTKEIEQMRSEINSCKFMMNDLIYKYRKD